MINGKWRDLNQGQNSDQYLWQTVFKINYNSITHSPTLFIYLFLIWTDQDENNNDIESSKILLLLSSLWWSNIYIKLTKI